METVHDVLNVAAHLKTLGYSVYAVEVLSPESPQRRIIDCRGVCG